MALNKTQAVIDRALRLSLFNKATGDVAVLLSEVEDFNVSVAIDNEKTATSASGSTIATFEQGKSGEMTGNASLFNYALMAAQSGSEAEQATSTNKIKTPRCDVVTIKNGKGALTQTPIGTEGDELHAIYGVLSDGGVGAKYDQATAASEKAFAYANGEITPPTGTVDGAQFYVFYDYESPTTIHIVEDADKFAETYRVVAEVIAKDVCSPETAVQLWVCNNAKLSTARDISLTTDGKHPFSLRLQSDYCGAAGTKRLFEIFAPDE